MKTSLIHVIAFIVIIGCFGMGFYFYQHSPELVPTHWNFSGDVDGYSSRMVAAFAFPAFILALHIFLSVIRYIDPKKDRYVEFKKPYALFRLSIVIALAAIYLGIGFNGIGYNIDMAKGTPVVIGALFIALGVNLGKIKPNWFVGIRTPWTLSSEEVWTDTHKKSGPLFVIGGALLICAALLPITSRLPLLIASLVIIIVGPILYSYISYKRYTSHQK